MNFNFEFDEILKKVLEILNKLPSTEFLKVLKENGDILGLSLLLLSLFSTNKILTKEKQKRKFDHVKDLTPGKIHVLEGKIFRESGQKSKKIASEIYSESIETAKKNSIIVNRILLKNSLKDMNNLIFCDNTGSIKIKLGPNFSNFSLSDYFIISQFRGKNNKFLKEGEKVILQNTTEKALFNRDIIRMKISIPYDFKISKFPNQISEIDLDFQSHIDNFGMMFYQPTFNSLINYNIFFRFLKNSLIVAHVVGLIYFSFKIFQKYFQKNFNKRNNKKKLLALPPSE